MANEPDPASPSIGPSSAKLVNQDTVQMEFMIDDLMTALGKNRIAAANCNGCNNCHAEHESVPEEE